MVVGGEGGGALWVGLFFSKQIRHTELLRLDNAASPPPYPQALFFAPQTSLPFNSACFCLFCKEDKRGDMLF